MFDLGAADNRIGGAVSFGRTLLLELLVDSAHAVTMIADVWGDSCREREFRATIDQWRRRFVNEVGQ